MHTPVLCSEVLTHFESIEGKRIIDCTLGEGGHTIALASRGAKVLAIDADEAQVERFIASHQGVVEKYGIKIVRGNYENIAQIAKDMGFEESDGVLFDFGLSMNQMHFGDGFSYKQRHQPLHMVIDTVYKQAGAAGAADVLAYKSESELIDIFEKYGEISRAKIIASMIVRSRAHKKIELVSDLIDILGGISDKEKAQVFQALRIVTNDEFTKIKLALDGAWKALKQAGVLQIISFHSGEDRIVKLWSKTTGAKMKKKILGKKSSSHSFEKSATLRVFVK